MSHHVHSKAPSAVVTGIDQICFVVQDFDAAVKALADQLGIGPFKCWTCQPPELFNTAFRGTQSPWGMKLGVALVGRTQWEVIQPTDPNNLFAEFLSARGAGVHHLLVDTGQVNYEASLEHFAQHGLSLAQSAMMNIPVALGCVTVPAAPSFLANALSTRFGYLEPASLLKTTLELAKFPPGISRPTGIRIGKPHRWEPAEATDLDTALPNRFIDHITKVGIVTHDLDATMEAYRSILGVGPFQTSEIDAQKRAGITVRGAASTFRVRAARTLIGEMTLEIVQPLDGASLYREALEQTGEGVHLIGLKSSLPTADDVLMRMSASGGRAVQRGNLWGDDASISIQGGPASATTLEFAFDSSSPT